MRPRGEPYGSPDALQFLLDLAARVHGNEELEPALRALVEGIGRLQGWDVGEAWVLAADGATIELGASWVSREDLRPFVTDSAGQAYRPGRGIVRRVWSERRAQWYEDLADLPREDFLRWRAAGEHGLRSAALAPIVAGERTVAVLIFFASGRRPPDEAAIRLVRAAAAELAWLLERRVQEAAVARANERYRLVTDQSRDLISLHGPDGRWSWVSPSVREVLGYEPEALAGRHPVELLHPDDSEAALTNFQALLRGDLARTPPYRVRHAGGRYVWLESVARAVRDPATGELRELLASTRDVSDRVRDRELLVASERSFRKLFADNPLPMWVFDTQTLAFLEVNSAAVELYGHSREAFLERTILDIRPPDERKAVLATVTAARPDLTRSGPWRHLTADGRILEVEIDSHATAFEGRDARLVVVRDVSGRARLERERQRRSRQLARLAEAAVTLHASDDLDTILERATEAAREVIGAHQAITSLPEEAEGAHARFRASLSERYAGYRDYASRPDGTGIYRIVLGERRPARMTQSEVEAHPAFRGFGAEAGSHPPLRGWLAAPLLGSGGRALGVMQLSDRYEGDFTEDDEAMLVQLAQIASVAIEKAELLEQVRAQAQDLERRVAERTAQLSALNRELEGFSYSVSHDLRAPLRAIDGFSLALLEEYREALDERGRHYLERARLATQRMGQLIDDLLALSRVGRAELQRREVDLSELARQAIAELREAEPERQVSVELPPELPARADPSLVRLVLQNLLGNAWKFTSRREGARIALFAEAGDGPVAYAVEDNGAGFDMRYAKQLFSPFQRLHTVDEFPGTGIGLATVQRIVQRHGGRVWAEGEVGVGATFRFTLGEENA